MKKITIYSEKNEVTLIDDDDSELSSYTKQISKLMDMSKICILETTSGSVVLKPSKISLISVSEMLSVDVNQKVTSVKHDVVAKDNSDVIRD